MKKLKYGIYGHRFHGFYLYCEGVKHFIHLGTEKNLGEPNAHIPGITEYTAESKDFIDDLKYIGRNIDDFIENGISVAIRYND